MPEPTKAYYVERVSRCVVTSLVYAENASEAIQRDIQHGESIDVSYQPKGYGRVRRVPEEDRDGTEAGR